MERNPLIEVGRIPFGIFDRLMNLYGEDFDDNQLLSVYCEAEAGALLERLPISIAVPIVCTVFEPEHFEIAPGIRLAALSEAQQLSRATEFKLPTSPINQTVATAATHALIFDNFEMRNRIDGVHQRYSSLSWYPVEKIDRFFDAMRTVIGLDTGYAETLLFPDGWAWHWILHLTRSFRVLPPAATRKSSTSTAGSERKLLSLPTNSPRSPRLTRR